jgi:hypothetical protein
MRSLSEIPPDARKLALEMVDVLLKFKAYLPPGGLLPMLLARLRDDIRESLEMATESLPRRETEQRSLDELTSVELGSVAGAVGILLQDRFVPSMKEPALPRLLGEFRDSLKVQKAERAQVRASIGAS